MSSNEVKHVPILKNEIVQSLIEPFLSASDSLPPQWFVDCTFGGGGHTQAMLEAFQSAQGLRRHRVLAFDQDPQAVARGRERFQEAIQAGRLEIVQSNFAYAAEWVGARPVLGLLADLGFSSDQLEDRERGLSFQWEGPLDMRLDPTQGMSCLTLLQQSSEVELEKILREWGEERFSRRIAAAMIQSRRQGKLPKTTKELVDLIVRSVPAHARHGKIHVATRTFQALRIAVNSELDVLDQLLEQVLPRVQAGGRIAVMSFHSLEDRRVKQVFKNETLYQPLTKKPIEACDEEVHANPRARSAKLRIAERVS
jgi:16S rRNA (cytosine1402-N4)-methyltransferase